MSDVAAPKSPASAASLILIRGASTDEPRILMGKRLSTARFMPDARVFPGGAVDPEDEAAKALLAPGDALPRECDDRLALDRRGAPDGATMALAAIRETYEETGVRIGVAASEPPTLDDGGESWRAFAASGMRPALSGVFFVLRAITPPQMKIRFDARIFAVDADRFGVDLDDFSGASGELEDLRWLTFSQAAPTPMPFPTALALAEVMAGAHMQPERPVPFVDQATSRSVITSL
ncbi:MAG: DNA mismatch repair protein MutT [Neomegalonema sp.]|nr:DNA mismatch repair protein MutT [Neomegalonema sp.]